ncbi:hypothetical protein DKX38_028334 [Salix brachista]|uniref:Receptor ligand binding region domain-containing protein n=1 Tax=Salix brachista TaxID=2182728 RepID=A0A5N5J5A9_9ROSI|nr:hypothetical protein DKX38_028334 [Salix brachista]
MAMPNEKFTLPFITFLLVNLWCKQMVIMAMEIIPVGVVLDLNSTVGGIAESCISMAVSDFYAVNADFKTRLALFTRDSSRDVVAATSSVQNLLRLMKRDSVGGLRCKGYNLYWWSYWYQGLIAYLCNSVLIPSGFLDCVGFLICLFSAVILICLSRRACKAFRNGTCN